MTWQKTERRIARKIKEAHERELNDQCNHMEGPPWNWYVKKFHWEGIKGKEKKTNSDNESTL